MIKTFSSYAIWACFAACNLAVAPLMAWIRPGDWTAPLVYLCLGTITAQAGLLAIWFVLWPQSSFSRVASCLLIATVLVAFWAMGYVLAEVIRHHRPLSNVIDEVLFWLFFLPAFQLAAQSPLWFARAVLRWRIDRPKTPDDGRRQGNLTIRGILIGTGLIALSLSLAKAAPGITARNFGEHVWIALGVGGLSVASIGLVMLPPVLFAVLRTRSPWLGSLLFLIYIAAVTASALFLCWLARVPMFGTDAWRMFGLFLSVLCAAVVLCVALLEIRRCGFRLRWGREQSTPPA